MTRHVVLVVGPPGAGKSTWVSSAAGSGVRVVDFDRIAKSLGSPVEHDHPAEVVGPAVREQLRQEAAIGQMSDGRAYVVRVAASPAKRAEVVARVRPDRVVTLDPGRAVVDQRTAGRSDSARAAVAAWYEHN